MAPSLNRGEDGAFRILLLVPVLGRLASVVPLPIVLEHLSGEMAEPRPSKFCHLDRNARTLLVRPSGIDCVAAVTNLMTSPASSRGGVGMIGFVSFIVHNLPQCRFLSISSITTYVCSCIPDTISYTPTCVLMLGIFVAYFVTIVLFAGMYLTINKVGAAYVDSEGNTVSDAKYCGMDINNHMEGESWGLTLTGRTRKYDCSLLSSALYFSLSTMATIGYGTSDYYFGDCWTPFILVLIQVFSAIVFSSLAVGLLFQRMSRGQKRGRTIVFSDVAVIRKVRGR
jgi:hypothetical protein